MKMTFGKTATSTPAPASTPAPKAETETKPKAPAKRGKKPAAEVVEAEESTPTTLVQQSTAAPAVRPQSASTAASAGFEGEVDASDLRIPRINLVNALSDLHTESGFDIGSYVLNKEIALTDKDGKLTFVSLYGRKRFQQKLDYQSDEIPLVFDTLAEVRAHGGTTDYSKEAVDEGRFFDSVGHFIVAVEAPANLDEVAVEQFPHVQEDGTRWARVAFTVSGGAYKSFARNIITAALGSLREGLYLGVWELGREKRTNKKGSWYLPTSRFQGKINDPSDRDFFADLANREVHAADKGEDPADTGNDD